MAQFINSKIGTLPNVLGKIQVVRASCGIEFEWDDNLQDFVEVEVEGSEPCITEVVPWMYEEDQAGIPFDKENLYGVRTRTWRIPQADGGGDSTEKYTAVPKTLPAEYVKVYRGNGILMRGFNDDYIGESPMYGHYWNYRTPTGTRNNNAHDPDQVKSRWSPMNLADNYLPALLGDVYSGTWQFYGPGPSWDLPETLWVAAPIAGDHVGFRGGKLIFTISAGYSGSAAVSNTASYEIVAVPIDKFWNPYDPATEADVEVVETGTFNVSFTSFADPPLVIEHTLGDMRPTEVGIPFNFYIRYPFYEYEEGGPFTPIISTSHEFKLSPRTDVPLHYSSSTANRIAPGGYVDI